MARSHGRLRCLRPFLTLVIQTSLSTLVDGLVFSMYQGPAKLIEVGSCAACKVKVNRREWIQASIAYTALLIPSSSPAASQARVLKQPGLEYLEPVYELQLSIHTLAEAIKDKGKWNFVKARLDKFFSGGLFSERNYYAGLGVQFMNQIEYEPGELKEYIRLDKEARFNAMEDALDALERLKGLLENGAPEKDVQDSVSDAETAIDRWFSLVPEALRQAVAELYVEARKADQNRDGKLDESELAMLDPGDREVWRKRIQLVGG